jgi:AcrR family transcriptional regulator
VTEPTREGLRARKRAASLVAIQKSAISLALAHGFDNITVEQICAESMVSQRTFFNYFGSKEGVILGLGPSRPTQEQLDVFVQSQSTDVVGDLVRMIAAALAERAPDPEIIRGRRKVIMRTPELVNRQTARISEVEDLLTRTILARFEAQGRNASTTPDIEDEARMVVALAVSVLRYSMKKWVGGTVASSPTELMHQSIELIRRITGDSHVPQ